ncbi:MAG: hypothetical protein IAE78_32485 [Myxococcus sp.]|nr:hypothetical protein [Myxococcus sp.]
MTDKKLEEKIIEAVRAKPQPVAEVVKTVATSPSKTDAARTVVRHLVDAGKLHLNRDWNLAVANGS